MESVDIPEARSLEKVRAVVQAIQNGVTGKSELAVQTDLSERHVLYHQQAARALGLLEFVGDRWHVTSLGHGLLSTSPGSTQEAKVFKEGIRGSSIYRIAPSLLEANAPTIDTIAKRLRSKAGLAPSTARKRATALLAWHSYIAAASDPPQRSFDFISDGPPARDASEETEGSISSEKPLLVEDAVDDEGEIDADAQRLDFDPPSPIRKPSHRPVITSIRLERFKSFKDATLPVGRFTVLIGTNASGKSNIRDAFRFLHGIARGYTLAEIIGEKWIEGGVLQWKGIRGGTREATFSKSHTFVLEVGFRVRDGAKDRDAIYRIEVEIDGNKPPRVVAERLVIAGRGQFVFDSHPDKNSPAQTDPLHLAVRVRKGQQGGFVGPTVQVISNQPALSQLLEHPDVKDRNVKEHVKLALAAFRSMRFLDLSPDAMRTPSLPGQTILGDRGENLSSVLLSICAEPRRREALIQWVRELTPMDAKGFEFPADPAGKVLLTLVEEDGSRTSAYSASDGTLRFLAMIAALLGPEPADLYFIEELENGIHPTRLHLLLQLIEQQTNSQACQVIATTHSPQLLAFLNEKSRQQAALVYRLKGEPASGIIRVLDIPHIKSVLEKQDIARLLSSGWLEDVMTLSAEEQLA